MQNNLSITHVPIGELRSSEYNPRIFSDEDIERVSESIRLYGLVDPCIVNGAAERKNIVIGGHLRLTAAKKLGITTVPVVYVDIPDVEKEKGLNLRLNRLGGTWDWAKLQSFDLDLLCDCGFDDADLNRVFDDALETEDDNFDVKHELAAIKVPTSKVGDLYQLGSHRLLCGDSTDITVVKRLCGEDRPDMIYTDIPYNISIDYSSGVSGKANYGGTYDDKKTDEEYAGFVRKIIGNALGVAKEDCHCFFWCDQSYVWLLQQLYRELGVKYKRTCLWIKNVANATPRTAFNKVYEPVVYGIRGVPYLSDKHLNLTEILNKEISTGNRAIDDILDNLDIWLVKRLPGNEYTHSTQKPPTLHEKPLRRCTRANDIVMDLTAGSGSTLISCEQMKRRAYLAEIEPVFADLIIRRFESLTGQKASLLSHE